MARNTKRGVCELCGAHANIGMNHGSAVCPKCTHIQSAINQRIEVVAKAARAMHKTEDLLGHLIPAGELAVHVTAGMLQEISNIVGYDGENPAELVEAVRGAIATKKATALDCGDCDLAGCFNELAELVDQRGASAGQVVEAVRRRALACASCDAEDVLHEIREIVGYTPKQGDKGLADAVRGLAAAGGKDCTNDEILLRVDLDRSTRVIEELRAELTLAQQARDEWESRSRLAEAHVETLEAELRNRYFAPDVPICKETYLLDIALRALRGEGPDTDQLAVLIDAARRAA